MAKEHEAEAETLARLRCQLCPRRRLGRRARHAAAHRLERAAHDVLLLLVRDQTRDRSDGQRDQIRVD